MQTVLITGGSSGIGYQISRLFAQDGYRLLWVSKPAEELAKAKTLLTQEVAQVEIHTLAKDLSEASAAQETYDWAQSLGFQVDVLVNNAGFATYGQFEDVASEKELAMIGVNLACVMLLTKLFVKDMVARDAGKILNISSAVSYEAVPLMAVYAGTKAFVRIMSESLYYELKYRKSKVQITTVCPAAIKDTRFQASAGMQKVRTFNSITTTTPVEVARDAYRGFKKGKKLVHTGLRYRLSRILNLIVPKALKMQVIRREMEELESFKVKDR
ncbi:MAG TPA: short-chain dehydrogenase [Microscillaceae bacterium]|nr:short-chain dehydrogenase [Microscillaceae bacterium]